MIRDQPGEGLAIDFDDVVAARRRLEGVVARSALRRLESLGVAVKLECEQETGSFKIRGAMNAVSALEPKGVVTGSSGNYGLALACAAHKFGNARAEVVVSEGFSELKRERMEEMGANVVVAGTGNSQRDAAAVAIAERDGLVFLPSHGSPLVFAGHGTIGMELVEDFPDIETVVVPIGAGGLIAGIAVALRAIAPTVKIIGVEPEAGDDTQQSLRAGRRIHIDPPDTICDAVRTQTPGELTFPIMQALVDEVVTVSDTQVREAMFLLWNEGISVEPTGALPVAAALQLGLGINTVCVLSGGNVSSDVHRELISPWVDDGR